MAVAALVLATGSHASIPSTYSGAKAEQVSSYLMQPSQYLFNSQELSLDVGPSYTTSEGKTIFSEGGGKGVWGIDIAGTYWIKRFAGIGLDTGIVNTKVQNDLVFSHVDAVVDGRIPLDLIDDSFPFKNTAITGKAAFGRDLQAGQYETTLGGGLEFRLTKHIGFGGLYQHVWDTDRANNKNQIITYLSLSF